KAFFIVNPGNPFAVALSPDTIKKIGEVLKKRPNLILLTDDVYGTFVPGFRSLMGEFPENTIGVYSYSKYFGCTGWRLGAIAVHEDNIFDKMIAAHPEPIKKLLDKRYGGLTLEPRKLAFIDRIVAASRDIAPNHTAGLSLPQQVMMTLFSLDEVLDEKQDYQKACIGICKKRDAATIEGLAIEGGPTLAVEQVAPADSALTSVEQGQTPLDESFDFRQWRLEKRRQALKDTKFEFNLRTFYLDRSDFSGAEKQAWAIGGWVGVKTGYFLDHIAFGATVYTSNPIYAPDDRDGTLLLAPGQNGYTVLGEFYAELRIVKDVGITVGAKGYDTPFINRNDTRMTPNTFEAIVLQGRTELGKNSSDDNVTADGIGLSKDGKEVAVPTPTPAQDVAAIKYGLGYFYKIKERNDSEFVSMSEDAGADVE